MSTYITWVLWGLGAFIVLMTSIVSTYLYKMDLINLVKGKYRQIK